MLSGVINLLPYRLGKLLAIIRGITIGKKCLVHYSFITKSPRKVIIGNNVQIRRGVELDGRSDKDNSLIIGDFVRIKEYCTLACYGGSIKIAHHVLLGRNTTIFGHGNVYIGAWSMISPNVSIISSEHVATKSSKPFQLEGFTREEIFIDENVWIGTGATILANISICKNVVIGAGSVVTNSIYESGIYGGIPAKKISLLPNNVDDNTKIFQVNWSLND